MCLCLLNVYLPFKNAKSWTDKYKDTHSSPLYVMFLGANSKYIHEYNSTAGYNQDFTTYTNKTTNEYKI